MTTWTLVEESPDYTVSISDAARAAYAEDAASQNRLNHATSVHTAVFMGSAVGLVVVLCAAFIIKILGAA